MPQIVRSLASGILAGVVIAVIFTAGFFVRDLVPLPAAFEAQDQDYPLLSEVITLVDRTYLRQRPDSITTQYAAIRGYLSGLGDPATFFIPPPETQVESDALAGLYGGIGVKIQTTTNGDFRVTPFEGSPALKAGIQDGDLLLEINGVPIERGTPIAQIDVQLRGEVKDGAGVDLKIRRNSNEREYFVPFDVIIVPSVLARVLEEDERIGYIQISDFTNRTPEELLAAAQMLNDSGVDALVLDLRNNGGGLLQEALTVAGEFLDAEVLLIERRRDSETNYTDQPGGALIEPPLIVLVNGGTASASEVVAGAIEDYDRGMLIGQKTYGKGTIQQIIQLSDKSSVHITFAEWLTPERRAIDGVGLEPAIIMIPAADGADVELGEAIRQLNAILEPTT
jgi:carboxyl-terminal processing protease